MRTLDSHFLAIDGRVRNQFTKEWYFQNHKTGAVVNSAMDAKEKNAKFQCYAGKPSYIHPYKNENSPDHRFAQKRIYIPKKKRRCGRATRVEGRQGASLTLIQWWTSHAGSLFRTLRVCSN